MRKPLVVISHCLEDHGTALQLVTVLQRHTQPAFDFALSTLGTRVFPQNTVAGRDVRALGPIALQVLICSDCAVKSQWISITAGFSRAQGIPTVLVRLGDKRAELPKSLLWFDVVEVDSQEGWRIFCEKCSRKCRGFPRFQPSQEELFKLHGFEPPVASKTVRGLPRHMFTVLDRVVVHLECWADEDKKFTSLCDAEGISYERGGADESTTSLDIIGDDFVLWLRRKHMDDLSNVRLPASGYDEPRLRWQIPQTRVYKIDATFCIKPRGFFRTAALVDIWRAELPLWRTVAVSLQLHDKWAVDRVRLREVSEGRIRSDLVADLDEGLLVAGIAIRLGSPRLLEKFGLRLQTIEFLWRGVLSRCEVGDALDRLLELEIVKQFPETRP